MIAIRQNLQSFAETHFALSTSMHDPPSVSFLFTSMLMKEGRRLSNEKEKKRI
jgi:hypothetical protein